MFYIMCAASCLSLHRSILAQVTSYSLRRTALLSHMAAAWRNSKQPKKVQSPSSSSSSSNYGSWGGYFDRQLGKGQASHLALPYNPSNEPSIPEYEDWEPVQPMRRKDAGWDNSHYDEQARDCKGKGKKGGTMAPWGTWEENKRAHREITHADYVQDGTPREGDALPHTWHDNTSDGKDWNYVSNSHSWRVNQDALCHCGYDKASCWCGHNKWTTPRVNLEMNDKWKELTASVPDTDAWKKSCYYAHLQEWRTSPEDEVAGLYSCSCSAFGQ
jgi:hypothetical protein